MEELTIQCLGDLDELNSHIGFLLSIDTCEAYSYLVKLQSILFDIGKCISYTCDIEVLLRKETATLESETDRLTAELPNLACVILPGGTPYGSYAHIARSVCRRSERSLVAYFHANSGILHANEILTYMNRLSDYLFTVARHASRGFEVPYVTSQKRH